MPKFASNCIALLLCLITLTFTACNFETESIPRNIQLESISLELSDLLQEYPAGVEFDKQMIKVFGHYSDSKVEEEDINNVIISNFDKDKIGTQTVTVYYNGKTAEFEVTVTSAKADHMEIINYPKN